MIEQNYNLDTVPFQSAIPVVHVSQYDSGSRTLKFKLLQAGSNYDMTGVTGAQINGKKPDGTEFSYNMTISNDVVSVVITEQMAAVAGRVMAEVVLTGANSSVLGTANFIIEVEKSPLDEGVISDTEIPIIMDFVTGGTPGQVFKRTTTGGEWADESGGDTVWGGITGDMADQTDLNNALTALNNNIDELNEIVLNAPSTDWGIIQKQVEAGLAAELYPVGTQFTVHHAVYGDMLFDVIGHDHDLPIGQEHSMTLLMHNVIYNTQFNEIEGFYYCEDGLTAGTYNVTITRQPWVAGDVGKTFQFTLANDVPAGAILWWDGYNATREGRTVSVFNTRGATSAAQTATMTEGNGGTALGSVDRTGNFNFFDRTVRGSNDWEKSGVRQWLNADVASDWWEPKTKWDRLVNYYSRPGFLYGLDADFKNVLVETTHGNRSNTVYDSHGTNVAYNTTEKIFLLCNEEVNLAQEQGIVCGTVYDYYENAADADRIKYDITSTSTARGLWLRSPYPMSAFSERYVNTSGALDVNSSTVGYGVAAACVIAGNGNTSGSVIGLINENKSAITALSESVAPIETGTASQPYAVGKYLILNGQFCKVTVAIATGETITVGTNVAKTSVGEELTPVVVPFTNRDSSVAFLDWGNLYKIGQMVIGTVAFFVASCTANTPITIGNFSNYLPPGNLTVGVTNSYGETDYLGGAILYGGGELEFNPNVTKSNGLRFSMTICYKVYR